jgi:hypothetical protein
MMRWSLLPLLLSLGCASTPHAVGPAPAPPPPVVIVDDGPDIRTAKYEPLYYTHATREPSSSIDTTGGIVRVRAPLAKAIETIMDFKHAIPLDASVDATVKVVAQEGTTRDVYVRVPTIIPDYFVWTLIRFEPTDEGDRGFVFRGRQIDGNLDDLRIYWRLVADGDETLARFELLGIPALPLPKKWILRDTKKGVVHVLDKFRWSFDMPFDREDDDIEDSVD